MINRINVENCCNWEGQHSEWKELGRGKSKFQEVGSGKSEMGLVWLEWVNMGVSAWDEAGEEVYIFALDYITFYDLTLVNVTSLIYF